MPGTPNGVRSGSRGPTVDPTWYKDAVFYELHVRSFADSTADGTGDFPGLTGKLDYLRDLGVTTLWLLPFYPSPLRDDGYDISDYAEIHPRYGSLSDFRAFLKAAHARGLRVVTELVLNHTSDQHPWFQRARRAPAGSPERDFYVWSDSPDRFAGARIIFKDFEPSNWTWDPVAKAYYWHRFYSHQPDLNYDNPAVARSIYRMIDFWLEMGVDGLRLDAVPYLFKREGTTCENLPETHAFLRELRAHVDERFPGRMLLAEANQWPEDAAAYFGQGLGDECHTAFHFPLMPRLFMAARMGTRYPIVDVLNQTPRIPDHCQWLLFLRNHDELTLEMVSDEERDYMYRSYAHDARMRVNVGIRRRLAPLLSNDRRLIELMNGLLFSLPGTPVVYYGDEIGMGDNIYLGDRNGVRTPMQWSPDRNAGFSRSNPQRLYLPVIIDPEYHYEAVNVEAQQANPHSLLWHMKRLIALRRQSRALGRGDLTLLYPDNPRVLAYVRSYEAEKILVVANLSNLTQAVDLDLKAFRETCPVEMFGNIRFPAIGEAPYRLTLGPYAFFWFRLGHTGVDSAPDATAPLEPVVIPVRGERASVDDPIVRERTEAYLPAYLAVQRWYRGKGLSVESARWTTIVPLGSEAADDRLGLVEVRYSDADPQVYVIPLGLALAGPPHTLGRASPRHVMAVLRPGPGHTERLLHDVSQEEGFVRGLLSRIGRNRRKRFEDLELVAQRTAAFRTDEDASVRDLPVLPIGGEQSNSSSRIGDLYVMKLFRTLENGENPETELGRFLLRHRSAPVAPLAGLVELRSGHGEVYTLASLHAFVPNEGDAWGHALDQLRGYFDRARAYFPPGGDVPALLRTLDLGARAPAPPATELIGGYADMVRGLGRRIAEFHLALASDATDPAFAPEPFDQLYARSIFQTMRTQRRQVFARLRGAGDRLPGVPASLVRGLLDREEAIDARYRRLLERRFSGKRIRIHGDLHLGQVLWTGKDHVIIDLEGEPLRSITERRLKRSPLRDVAGMLRSFDYAARTALLEVPVVPGSSGNGASELLPLAELWVAGCSAAFLQGYREVGDLAPVLPSDPEEYRTLLTAYLAEKAVYEIEYELDNRPAWLSVPLHGLSHLLASDV